jgi:hypothetical protein
LAGHDSTDSELEELRDLLPKQPGPLRPLLGIAAVALLVFGVVEVYRRMPERGASLGGDGYLVVRPDGTAWVMLNTGGALLATRESVARLHLQTGPCDHIEGGMLTPEADEMEIEKADCKPSAPLLPVLTTRMHYVGAKFGYWADGLKPAGDDLETPLRQTPEVIAAVIDPRADFPQLIPLYAPVFPASLERARKAGLPPPVLVSIRRNDLLINRYRLAPLVDFLHRDRFVFAGAAVTGGWLVRDLVITPDGTPSLERLLVAPEEAPWPERLGERTVRVARREPPIERLLGGGKTGANGGPDREGLP